MHWQRLKPPQSGAARKQLLWHVQSIRKWQCGIFFLGSLCHADPTFAGWRNVALWRFSLTFGHEEGIRQFLLYKSPVIWEEWELFSCPDPAVMSGLDRAVYLIPPRLDLPENKLRPPRSCCSMKSVCSCELLPRLDCPHKQLRLWSQTGKPVLSCRQKTINWFKLGGGRSDGGRPILDEWLHFVIRIADPESAHDCLCCVKCVLLTAAGAEEAEFDHRWFLVCFYKAETKSAFRSHFPWRRIEP